MSFITGTNTKCLILEESSFGTVTTAKTGSSLVNITSESLSTAVEKGDEGSLLGSKTAVSRDLMSITVSGSLSSILRPEFADALLKLSLGKSATVTDESIPSGYSRKSYTLADVGATLPSFSTFINRGTGYKVYDGCTFGTLNIEATANDYVKVSNDITGHKELTTALSTADTATLNGKSYSKPSYRCTQAEMKVNGTVFDVETATVNISNALVEAPKTYSSGLYAGQPQSGQREVTVSFNIPYSSEVDTFKNTYLTSEENASVVLKFTTSDANEYLEISIPNVAITSVSNNVSGTGLVEASCEGTALSVGSTEPITIVVQSKN
jgi:hypothetical protein